MVKRTLLSLALLAAVTAHAECYYSSSTTTEVGDTISEVDHIMEMHGQGTCTITARVLYHKKWYSIAGAATNESREPIELCLDALEMGVRDFLLRQNKRTVKAQQQMICTDLPTTKIHPVQVGEQIRISEVQPHPTRKPFDINGNECRWFVEPFASSQPGYINNFQGIACRVGRFDDDRWVVLEKQVDR